VGVYWARVDDWVCRTRAHLEVLVEEGEGEVSEAKWPTMASALPERAAKRSWSFGCICTRHGWPRCSEVIAEWSSDRSACHNISPLSNRGTHVLYLQYSTHIINSVVRV
jgi:hypothetical protein